MVEVDGVRVEQSLQIHLLECWHAMCLDNRCSPGLVIVISVRNERGLGVQDLQKTRGTSHKKEKCKLEGGSYFLS